MGSDGPPATIYVQVVYAVPGVAWQAWVALPQGATVSQAVEASEMAYRVSGYRSDGLHFGVFGQNCGSDRVLAEGDRVEIYRPLTFDPLESRRRRATHRKG